MIEDFRAIPSVEPLEADICIIGAGPSGLALAHELAATTRLNIILLESGGLGIEPAAQALSEGIRNKGIMHRGLGPAGRGRAFGGSGRLWAGQCLPLDPIDFEARPWVPFSGWPLTARCLEPYVRRAENFFKVEGEAYDERNHRRFGLTPPRWSSEALQSVFTVYAPRIDIGATWARNFARLQRLRVLLYAVAVGIETTEDGHQATGVRVALPGQPPRLVRARSVVLSAGALENARLLLLSQGAGPAGLGNRRGLVGRFFQEHPTAFTATLDTEGSADLADLQTRFRLLYGRGGIRYFPKFALAAARQRNAQVLNCNAHLVFDFPDDSAMAALREFVHAARQRQIPAAVLRKARLLPGSLGEVGRALLRRYVKGLSPLGRPSQVRLQCYLEQAPDPDCRVTLLPGPPDALGLRAMSLDWRLGELERRTLQVMTATVGAEFARLGLGRMRPAEWLDAPGTGWRAQLSDCRHHLGTTRMAATPLTGVVDPDCKVFDVQGLYVAGGSVFPTSGYANPTLAMVALAIRLAEHLRNRLAVPHAAAA